MNDSSFRFTNAICKKPTRAAINGLRAVDVGAPDLARFLAHHEAYVEALATAGIDVNVLEGDEDFPDSVFIEDTALCLPQGAIIMRPGAPSRLGETEDIASALEGYYGIIGTVIAPGFIEGGDILVTGKEILVGLSDRTNAEGFRQFSQIVEAWGHKARMLQTPEGVLHFKTDCGLLDGETILATKRLADSGCFEGYRVIEVEEGEEPVANAIRVNDVVFMPEGFPKTAEKVTRAGYTVKLLPNSEAAKLDGGLSCMSLRFSPPS